jgi:hypothetical protein
VIRVLAASNGPAWDADGRWEADVTLDAGGRRVRWKVAGEGSNMRNVVWLDDEAEPSLRLVCGCRRMAEQLRTLLGGEPWAWELVGDLLTVTRIRVAEVREALTSARATAYDDACRQAAVAYGRRKSHEERRPRAAWVYLFAAHGRVKIGHSVNPVTRARNLSTTEEVTVLARKRFRSRQDARAAEVELHQRFAQHRIRGEWFEDCELIREAFGVSCG